MIKFKNKTYKSIVVLIILISFIKLNPFSESSRASINMFSNSNFIDVFNLKPFNTIGDYITNFNNYNTSIVVKFFLTNFLLFIPLALILGINDISKKISLTILIAFPIVLELLQAWFRIGVFDIDAILINILSSMFVLMLSNRFAKNQNST